jgi:glycosyltransferase involved in cell wall biosynthesis
VDLIFSHHNKIPRLNFEEESLAIRISSLSKSVPNIVWVYEKPDSSTFRYRVINMVNAINILNPIQARGSWFALNEIRHLISHLEKISIVVLVRIAYDERVAHLISCCKTYNIKLIFDCDDLVFNPSYVHCVLDSLDQYIEGHDNWNFWFGTISRTEEVAKWCDYGITTNRFLAKQMQYLFDSEVKVIPNFLNKEQQLISDLLFEEKNILKINKSETTTIGYFSGSPTHNKDWLIAANSIIKILKKYPRVNLHIVGYANNNWVPSGFSDQVHFHPHQHFIDLQRLIASVDINIAPLQFNTFTNCKSELKYFEAAIVGTWSLATPTFPFSEIITSPLHGQLVESDCWDEEIEKAIQLVQDFNEYKNRGIINRERVTELYGWNVHGKKILDTLLG